MSRIPRSTRRLAAASAAAAALALLLASTAFAGGWASATLDSQPDDPVPGGTMLIGFTLLQHGVAPVDWGQPLVMLVDQESGQRITAEAQHVGKKGHWTAELVVPSAGTWQLDIRHDLEVVPANFKPITVGVPGAPAAQSSLLAAVAQPAILLVGAFLGLLAMGAAALGMVAWRRARTDQARV
jgi:hypothetical protein